MKTQQRIISPVPWGLLAAFAFATAACGTSHRESTSGQATSSTTAAQSNPTAETQALGLTGCLQEGNRGTYILTDLNGPKQPDSSNPIVVAREKLAAAEEAYVLRSSAATDLSTLLGKRVHVEGTLARSSDLVGTTKAGGESVGTAGHGGEVTAIESGRVIREKDLAQVQVSSVRTVADTCSTHAAGTTPGSE